MSAVRRLPVNLLLTGVVFVVLLPLIPLAVYSVAGRWLYPDLLPESLNVRAWRYVGDPRFRVVRATFTSLAVALTVTGVSLLLGVPAGRGLAALRGVPRRLADLLFFGPVIVPALSVSLGLHVTFTRIGLSDRFAGVVVAHLLPALPYMVLVMAATFAATDNELELQARTLGARPLRAFLSVGVPAAVPGILTGALFVFLISWSQYALTLLIGGGRVLTLPVLLFAFVSAGDQSLVGALGIVFVAPAVAVLLVTSRYLTGRSPTIAGVVGR